MFTEILPGVYQLGVRRANVAILVEGSITIVDSGMPGSAPRILDFLSQQGRSPEEVSRIIITHRHVDHAGGLAELQRLTGARVGAHPEDAPYIDGRLTQPNPFRNPALRLLLSPLGSFMKSAPAKVDLLLKDGDELDVLGGLRVLHTPGHTEGSLCLFAPDRKLLIVGDTLNNRWGRLSLAAKSVSVDMKAAREAARRLSELDFEHLVVGHGPPIIGGAGARLRKLVGD